MTKAQWKAIYNDFPHLWEELKVIQDMPNKIQENITRTETLYDIERRIKHGVQEKFFVPMFMKE